MSSRSFAPIARHALVLTFALTLGAAAPARADELPDWGRALANEVSREKTVPYSTPFVSLLAGYHGDVAAFGELRVGWGKGTHHRAFLFPTTKLWRFSAAVRGAYGREDSVAASLLAGWSSSSLLGVSIEGGVDARLDPGDRGLGPILTAAVRAGPLGLHGTSWVHFGGGERDWGFTVGLGWTFLDYRDPIETAADRGKDELRDRGIPVP